MGAVRSPESPLSERCRPALLAARRAGEASPPCCAWRMRDDPFHQTRVRHCRGRTLNVGFTVHLAGTLFLSPQTVSFTGILYFLTRLPIDSRTDRMLLDSRCGGASARFLLSLWITKNNSIISSEAGTSAFRSLTPPMVESVPPERRTAHHRLDDVQPSHVNPDLEQVLRPQHPLQARFADTRQGAQDQPRPRPCIPLPPPRPLTRKHE